MAVKLIIIMLFGKHDDSTDDSSWSAMVNVIPPGDVVSCRPLLAATTNDCDGSGNRFHEMSLTLIAACSPALDAGMLVFEPAVCRSSS